MGNLQANNPTFIAFILTFALVMLMVILRNRLIVELNQGNDLTAGADSNHFPRWKFAVFSGIIFFSGVSLLVVLFTFGLTISLAYQKGNDAGAVLGILESIFSLLLSLNCLLIVPFVPITLLLILGMYHRLSMNGDYWLDRIWKNPRLSDRERRW
jgi:hypothetical protein